MFLKPRHGFSLIELLAVVAVLAVLACLLFPVYGSVRRAARRTTCLSNLRQTGLAAGLYQGDANGLLPVGTIVRIPELGWPVRDVLRPLDRYAGGDAAFRCPENDWRFSPRWVVSVGTPETSRLMVADPSNVLIQCMHHLDQGWQGGPSQETLLPVAARRGSHLVLRADLSAGQVDCQTLKSFLPEVRNGQEVWVPSANEFGLGHGVFDSERWPPEWVRLPENPRLLDPR